MKILYVILYLFISSNAFCQTNHGFNVDSIIAEAKKIYRSERASWLGTDLFLSQYKGKNNVGGYFSYFDGANTKCVFLASDINPLIIGTITFDEDFAAGKTKVEIGDRDLTETEKDIWSVRKAVLELVNVDTFFKKYTNVNYNIVPIVSAKERKVYIIMGANTNGILYFGNDYLITLDLNNNITNKKRLHNSLIPCEYGKSKDEVSIQGGFHSHLPALGELITATDICTLMLYEDLTRFKFYGVVSANYTSLWLPGLNQLTIYTNQEFKNLQER